MKKILGEIAGAVSIAAVYLLAPVAGGDTTLAFPVAAVVGIVAVAGAAFKASKDAKKAQQKQAEEIARREGLLEADKVGSLASGLQGQFRELAAMGAIPGFQQAAATQASRRGLTGTGLGMALQTAAGGAGEMEALRFALENAVRLRSIQAGLPLPPTAGPGQTASLLGAVGQGLLSTNFGGGGGGGGGGSLFPSSSASTPGGFNAGQFLGGAPFQGFNSFTGSGR